MKIAIHHNVGSFSERWIVYCEENNIAYKIVDCYQTDLINQIRDCDALMWHHHHGHYKDVITAKRILFALEHAGVKVFPDFKTGWHFDDKVAQKYLFEAIGAPLVPSFVFYDKKEALNWAAFTTFPKVFKLKGGAGSANVKLIRTKSNAIKLINKAFGKGFSQFNRIGFLKEKVRGFKEGRESFVGILKGIVRLFITTEFAKIYGREKGYVYFQEFIPNNTFDIRVIVVGDKAFAIKRLTRENDFRASGSGIIVYDRDDIDERCIQIAFDVNRKLNTQSIAYDFVFDEQKNPLIIEISYGYDVDAYNKCEGYWDENIIFYEGKFKPQYWMMQELVKEMILNKN